MSAGGGAMVRGNALTSNKGAPTDESNFTHTGDTSISMKLITMPRRLCR